MKKNILRLLAFFIASVTFGQNIDNFKEDFKKAIESDFNETDLNDMFRTYSNLLTPHSDITQLTASLKNERIIQYPLSEFRETDNYKSNIQLLLNSKNPNHRLLSYLVIAGTGDTNYEKDLLDKIKTEDTKGNRIWSGMALMYLQTTHTTPLFDFLTENENFGDSHMIPLYFKLNKDSLQNTAYNKINSENIKAKILSAQLLSITGKNKKTEQLLLNAAKNWEFNIKGYAIYSIKELQIGNLKEVFIPLLDSTKTRRIAIQALTNSPTKEDVDYIKEIASNQKIVSKDILNGFLESKSPENVKYFLQLIASKDIEENYYLDIHKQPLLFSDELLIDTQRTLKTTKHIEIQKYLIKVLQGRKDSESMKILLNYLNNKDSSVRYWTVDALKSTKSSLVIDRLIKMLKQPEKRVSPITEILIRNEINTLQETYTDIYKNSRNLEWERSSIEYLSTFPKNKHKVIFKDIIQQEDSDFAINRDAVMGLANLKDTNSIDRIIEVSEKERLGSDSNCQTYIIALSKIKGSKSKEYILTFKNSDSENIRELVTEIITNW
ncbi:MAG: hypothetical protein COA88_09570 [Kordia sp.]|nr:MAG: hypothetical protein COA88_09570 [Kordia sp.]